MNGIKEKAVFAVLSFLLVLAACTFGPPPSCGDNIGGTANTAKFDQFFTAMSLINQATGQPGGQGESGVEFDANAVLVIQVNGKAEAAVRACVQPMGGGGALAFNNTKTLSKGEAGFEIGKFKPGNYVIRVIVEDTLVKNFPFVIK